MSIERTTVYADPTLVTDPAAKPAALAPLLHVDEPTLFQRLSDKGTAESPRRFVYLAHTVGDERRAGGQGAEAARHRLRARVGAQLSRGIGRAPR